MNNTSKLGWRRLYITGAAGIALMFLVPSLHLSDDMQKVAFFVITVALCCGMSLWLSASQDALQAEELSPGLSHHYAKSYYTLNPGAPLSRTSTDDDKKEVA